MQPEIRLCQCGNPAPMDIRQGSRGPFYTCSDRGCRLTQDPNTKPEQYTVGSTAAPVRTDSMQQQIQAWKIECNSIETGYQQRKAWHEKHDVPFPETAPPQLPPAPGRAAGGLVRDVLHF